MMNKEEEADAFFEKQAEIVSLQNITSIRDFGDYCSVDP